MIIVHGSIPIRPERRDQALALAKQMAAASRNEKGCMSYEFYVGLADPDTLMLFQEWESMEAAERGYLSKGYQEALAALGDGAIREFRYVEAV